MEELKMDCNHDWILISESFTSSVGNYQFESKNFECAKCNKEKTESKNMQYELKDSGERKVFETGAQRDISEGKGRYDLISPIAIKRLAIVMEKGAKKYKDRNWELGMPLGKMIDSAKRHIDQFLEGYRDEDHLGQAMFNIMGAIHIEEMVKRDLLPKELNDLPNYMPKQ